MRRWLSVWLPTWPTDRWRRQRSEAAPGPLALYVEEHQALRIHAVDGAAAAEGLAPGQPLADARALVPNLLAAPADLAGDAEDLGRLVDWARRYSPLVAGDGADGLLVDLTGAAHLQGGEEAVLGDIVQRLGRARLEARAAVADTAAQAWAWARFAGGGVVAVGAGIGTFAPLPVAALRLPPALIEGLQQLGLRRVGDVSPLPLAPLVRRFGREIVVALDALSGRQATPATFQAEARTWRRRASLVEPISTAEAIETALRTLLDSLCAELAAAGRGARTLELTLFRVDATSQRVAIGTSRPLADTAAVLRLFRDRIAEIDPGFGIEAMLLEAAETDRILPAQADLAGGRDTGTDLADLIDRIEIRSGPGSVRRLLPADRHWPEAAAVEVPATLPPPAPGSWSHPVPRPVVLFERPEPIAIETRGLAIDAFNWRGLRHRLDRVVGPERVEPEWGWDTPERTRDYYRVEDDGGRRYWIFVTAGDNALAWFLHGLFA
ncbi:protein ImuB [Inquilinus ginsengisoli]|uniref:Y-family DNA polymerase n=1 Tax=Inquilinus ginsengisoli TaxID=363840 RepID=UPI003D25ED0E